MAKGRLGEKVARLRIPLAMLVLICGLLPTARASAPLTVGQPAPDFSATELDGSSFNLAAVRGDVVILNIWATWCGPCRTEMPTLDAYYRSHHSQGVELIGLSADRSHDRGDVAKVMAHFSYPAALLSDVHPNVFGMPRVVPQTYVIDTAGIVRAYVNPNELPLTAEHLNQLVAPLLAQRNAAAH